MFKTIVLVLRIEVYSYCIAEHRIHSCQFLLVCISSCEHSYQFAADSYRFVLLVWRESIRCNRMRNDDIQTSKNWHGVDTVVQRCSRKMWNELTRPTSNRNELIETHKVEIQTNKNWHDIQRFCKIYMYIYIYIYIYRYITIYISHDHIVIGANFCDFRKYRGLSYQCVLDLSDSCRFLLVLIGS